MKRFSNEQYNDEQLYEQSVESLKNILEKMDNDIKMPESLLGSNLIHLLEQEDTKQNGNSTDTSNKKKKKTGRIIDIVFSKKAVPAFLVALAAVFAIVVIPRVQLPNQIGLITEKDSNKIETAAQVQDANASDINDSAENDTALNVADSNITDDGSANVEAGQDRQSDPNQSAGQAGQDKGGEDLSIYFDENGNLKNGNTDNDIEIPPSNVNDAIDEESKSSGTSRGAGNSGGSSTPRGSSNSTNNQEGSRTAPAGTTGGAGTESSNNSVASVPEQPAASPPNTGGGSDDSGVGVFSANPATSDSVVKDNGYYLGEWKGYNVYWKTIDPTTGTTGVALKLFDSAGNEVVNHTITGVYQVKRSFVTQQDSFLLIGAGSENTVLYQYSGIDLAKGTVVEASTKSIVGDYSQHSLWNNHLYLMTYIYELPSTYAEPVKQLKNSGEKGIIGVLIWDLSANESSKYVFSGTDTLGVSFTHENLVIEYLGKEGETYEVIYKFDGIKMTEK